MNLLPRTANQPLSGIELEFGASILSALYLECSSLAVLCCAVLFGVKLNASPYSEEAGQQLYAVVAKPSPSARSAS